MEMQNKCAGIFLRQLRKVLTTDAADEHGEFLIHNLPAGSGNDISRKNCCEPVAGYWDK
jgi:hypothetical protein